MSEEELESFAVCNDCGVEFDPGVDRGYTFEGDGVLCPECARRRGGVYDDRFDTWATEPDVADLLNEHGDQ